MRVVATWATTFGHPIALSRDGRLLAVGGYPTRVWAVAGGPSQRLPPNTKVRVAGGGPSLAFSP